MGRGLIWIDYVYILALFGEIGDGGEGGKEAWGMGLYMPCNLVLMTSRGWLTRVEITPEEKPAMASICHCGRAFDWKVLLVEVVEGVVMDGWTSGCCCFGGV